MCNTTSWHEEPESYVFVSSFNILPKTLLQMMLEVGLHVNVRMTMDTTSRLVNITGKIA